MKKETYTKEEVLKIIEEAFWDGIAEGGVEYGGDNFLAEDYLLDEK